ncbi:hypothetical protein pb186bvf_017450 [Paramecium bursaria]
MQIIFNNAKQQINSTILIVNAFERTSVQVGYLEFIIKNQHQATYRMDNVEQFSKIQPDHRLFVKFNDQSQKHYQAMLIQKDDLDPYVIQILNCPKSPNSGDVVTSIQRSKFKYQLSKKELIQLLQFYQLALPLLLGWKHYLLQ